MPLRRTLALSATALVIAACGGESGGGGDAPSVSTMASEALTAMDKERSVAYDIAANAKVKASSSATAETRRFTDNPLELRLKGGASPTAFSADGTAQGAGQTFSAKAMLDESSAYVNFLGAWYGTKEAGLKDATDQAQQRAGANADLKKAVATIKKYGDKAFDGEVEEGPETDGTETWELKGKLDTDGLVEIARAEGENPTQQEIEEARRVFERLDLELTTGKEDDLPRHLEVRFSGTAEEIAALSDESDTAAQLKEIESMEISFTADFSKWGEKVTIKPPASFEPLESLVGSFIGQ